MLTSKEFISLSRKDLVDRLNGIVASIKPNDSPEGIRHKMFQLLEKNVDFKIRQDTYSGSEISGVLDERLRFSLKVSTKKDGDKFIVGGFKIAEITYRIPHYKFGFVDINEWTIKLGDSFYTTASPNTIYLTHLRKPLKEFLNIERLIEISDEQERVYDKDYKGFYYSLSKQMADGIIERQFSIITSYAMKRQNAKKEDLKFFPQPYRDELPDEMNALEIFDQICKVVASINASLMAKVIKEEIFKTL